MVKQGFRDTSSLALRLMNAVSSVNGRRKRMEQFASMRYHPRCALCTASRMR